MNFLRRDTICDRLRLNERQSYRIVGSSYGDRISSDEIVGLLNRSRRGMDEPVTEIPTDLLTPIETAERFAGSEITTRELSAWVRRTKNIPPHFRLNRKTIRFSARMLEAWLERRSKIRRHA